MFYFVSFVLTFLPICWANVQVPLVNTATRSPIPLLHKSDLTTQKINDADYWDDDFVPYKSDRHDTFDWRLLKTVLLNQPSNVIISPFSVKLVLALLSEAAGAESPTQKELSSIFPYLKSSVLVREHYKPILESLKENSIHYDLNIGTKIFVDQFIEPRQRYAAIIKAHYDADIEKLSFADRDTTAKLINDWCINITDGHLKNLVTTDDVQNSIMLMINAVYFNGLWRRGFPDNATFESPFLIQPNTQVKTQYMTQVGLFYYFESTKLNAKFIRLPYKGKKFSMTIVLPMAKGGLDELVREIEGDSLRRTMWLMDEIKVKVTLPKFKFDYTSHMKEILQTLGINDIFSDDASLPGLARGAGLNNQLKVTNIIQKSGLDVNEKGSTAYAATVVEITNKFGESNTVEEFNANRPFIFFIEDETTGTMLFAGKVIDPTK